MIIVPTQSDRNQNTEEAIQNLYEDLIKINPSLGFQVASFSISPIPGTPQAASLRASGLLRFDDPSIYGSIWTPTVDTIYLSYKEIADWQIRLMRIGNWHFEQ
uniref:Uncharacterized protein n=1 Tax=Candidatus Kentrum sp. MB TaxID=2138164 RepID=A0A450XYM7_9GAMM|nr:MAG: hypothetical protein BECKMB1821G_GA0114241_10644 [Candidatus Kentron sp. MB]VFK34353.1 MAG: hypothetical protein BECKMB1821I_GA0114274_10693 [Candidatus Kentron sp. MB]VFK76672.1 MAG: hypothetical protein BECKMB1821H_GA0114242_10682 [Candidatus Kentron sp. MB]